MGIMLHFELGASYKIIFEDDSSFIFQLIGGADPEVNIIDEDDNKTVRSRAKLSELLKPFRSIERID